MILDINYEALQLVGYEGAGNITPVLDLSSVRSIDEYHPLTVKKYLENDETFRLWLQQKGRKLNADSIMIYYPSEEDTQTYVVFVGEPNASLTNPFSEMCGNGIRCLALHILLNTKDFRIQQKYQREGIYIWAADQTKVITFDSVDLNLQRAQVRVAMGKFQTAPHKIKRFVDMNRFKTATLGDEKVREYIHSANWGIGFNGNDNGEPHLALLYSAETFSRLSHQEIKVENVQDLLRYAVCFLGNHLTFNTELFPEGINVNVGVLINGVVHMSTHERNLVLERQDCTDQQELNRLCKCNTLACGTGGAAVANIAVQQNLIESSEVRTVHTGGEVRYLINKDETIMIGPATRRSIRIMDEYTQTSNIFAY